MKLRRMSECGQPTWGRRSVAERPILELDRVCAGFGETVVLEDIHFALDPGESVSVIGRNGVGKSTLLSTIMGQTTLHEGTIRLGGIDVGHLKSHQRVASGLGYVPQEREIFPSLTVCENLTVAARSGKFTLGRVAELFPHLRERWTHLGSHLSGGEQQMLAIGRALLANPSVLLMDEPSEGLAPLIVSELQRAIHALRDDSALAVVLVEQNSHLAFEFSERCIVMNRGRIVRDGVSSDLRADRALLDRLVGVDVMTATRNSDIHA